MTSGVYCIESPSGKKYIGSSKDLDKRWKQHLYRLKKGNHFNRHLQSAWYKYQDKLDFRPILICEPKDLILYEQICLDFYKPEYNISKHADKTFNALGVKRSEETRSKISKALMGKNKQGHPQPEYVKQMISARMKGNRIWLGRNHSDESKRKMSEAQKGRPSPNKGGTISDAQKKFLSESRRGPNNPMYGKTPWNKKVVEA